ncbi:MAG TPA: ABC transporter permease [Thermoguttaceae bacterium]|nr:ABC transporter permease [Thermoguttaceae bacterium]
MNLDRGSTGSTTSSSRRFGRGASRAASTSCDPLPAIGPITLPEVVYTPDSSLRQPTVLLSTMVRDLLASRELAWRLFVRDVQAMYRKSLLGYTWILLTPLVMTLCFTVLRSRKILNLGDTDIPYPAYVLVGMLLWEAFSASLVAPLGRINTASSLLTKLRFPHEALILTSFYYVVFDLTVKMLLVVGAWAWFRIDVGLSVLLFPLAVLALIGLGFTLGVILVPIGQLYQDVGRSLGVVTRIWFFATPVIYPLPDGGIIRWINQFNPVSPLLVTARELLTGEPLTQLPAFLAITAASIVVGLAAWVVFRISMPHLIARMSA